MRAKRTQVSMVAVTLLLLLWASGSVRAHPPAGEPPRQGRISVAGVTQPLLQYQGRLTNPSTGEPVADGSDTMTFGLYGEASAINRVTADYATVGGGQDSRNSSRIGFPAHRTSVQAHNFGR